MKGALIIDDDFFNSKLLEVLLLKSGFQPESKLKEYEEIFNSFNPQNYALIIVDYNLIGITGPEIVRRLRNEFNYKNVIWGFSASDLSETQQEFMDAGVDRYLKKPVDNKDILAMLENI